MSTAAAVWSEESVSEATVDNEWLWPVHEQDVATRASEWYSLLRARHAPLFSPTKGAGDEDLILDSPNWLGGRLAELRQRKFVRRNDPRRTAR